jgi:hypothetical protein
MGIAPEKFEKLAAQLKELSEALAGAEAPELPAAQAKRIRKTVSEAYKKLHKVIEDLDPIKHPGFVFDPSNPGVVGRVAGIAMIAQPRKPLANVEKFYGSGVYAIFRLIKVSRRRSIPSMWERPIRRTQRAKPPMSRVTGWRTG